MPGCWQDFLDSRIVDHPVVVVELKPVLKRIEINHAEKQENYGNRGIESRQTVPPLAGIWKILTLRRTLCNKFNPPLC